MSEGTFSHVAVYLVLLMGIPFVFELRQLIMIAVKGLRCPLREALHIACYINKQPRN